MSISNSYIEVVGETEKERLNDRLSFFDILDIGIINSINGKNRASITGVQLKNGKPRTYTNIEVLHIGNAYGHIGMYDIGSLCLLIGFQSCIPDTKTLNQLFGTLAFDIRGIKAIPISNGNNTKVCVGHDGTGSFVIGSTEYTVSYDVDSVRISTSQGPCININQNLLQVIAGTTDIQIKEDGSVTKTYSNKDMSSNFVFSFDKEGNLKLTQSSGTKFDTVSNNISFSKDGALNIVRGENKIDITDDGISIQDSNGNKVEMSSGGISLVDSNGNKVEMSSSGVTLQGKSGKVEIM